MFIAHKYEEGEIKHSQSIKEHLLQTGILCSKFAQGMCIDKYAYLTALLHDIGKYSDSFQKRINGINIKTDHSTAGAKEALKTGKLAAAFAIAGHHSGLPDCGNRTDDENSSTLIGRSKKTVDDYSCWKKDSEFTSFSAEELPHNNMFDYSFYIRMLFSCLVDADFLDTENFMSGGTVHRESGDSIDLLLTKLNNYTKSWGKPNNELNKIRNEISNDCLCAGQNSSEKLFSLTVPTGGGKTISSMTFALNYAIKHNKKRIIYVIPYTSIIEQNAEVFREIFGAKNVLEHHCNVDYSQRTDEEVTKAMLACENWDSPIIVTTAVQFFESLHSNKPSSCRKLHNLSESVIIFDETQMLPVNYLQPCVSAMWFLADKCNSAVVLCTATQPSLEKFFQCCSCDESLVPKEICIDTEEVFQKLKRVKYHNEGVLSEDDLITKITSERHALCIVNTKRAAENIFNAIDENNGDCFCLTTHMYPEHRKQVLNKIREKLKNGEICRVVSTSLIEAGVDVDFCTVFRELAGIDSILQAGGRCNRENKHSADDSVVHVFRSCLKNKSCTKIQKMR